MSSQPARKKRKADDPTRVTLTLRRDGKELDPLAFYSPGTSTSDLRATVEGLLGLQAGESFTLKDARDGAVVALSPGLPSGLVLDVAVSGNGVGAGSSGAAGPSAAPAPGGTEEVVIQYKFASCKTAVIEPDQFVGTLDVPMLRDLRTGLCKLAPGATDANGAYGDTELSEEASTWEFTATFARPDEGGPISSLKLGLGLESSERRLVAVHDAGTEEFVCDFSTPRKTVRLNAWEKNQGGVLCAYALIDIPEVLDPDYIPEGTHPSDYKATAYYKAKLYTVLSAWKPDQKVKDLPRYKQDRALPNWEALKLVVLARNPRRPERWAEKAVLQYRHFLALKKEHQDWDSKLFSPSGPLDTVWHAHLSFVERYQRDILAFTGGHLIEHSPVLGGEAKDRYSAAYKEHRERMGQSGEQVDAEFWPAPSSTKGNGKSTFHVPHDGDSGDELKLWDEGTQCG